MPHTILTLIVAAFGWLAIVATPGLAAGTDDGSSDASDSTGASTGDAYDEAKAMVEAGNYVAALPALMTLTADDAKNADAWNLLGFTHRKLGEMEASSAAYLKVLTINPDHLGALEYQGELFLDTGKPDLAKANLARLQTLCGTCEEAMDLEKAIMAAGV
jgi:tetratricopeptide (TPR) repeat protein